MSSLREINVKNRRCCYPGNKINIKKLGLNNILVYEKPGHKNFIYHVCNTKPHTLKKSFRISIRCRCIENHSVDQYLPLSLARKNMNNLIG